MGQWPGIEGVMYAPAGANRLTVAGPLPNLTGFPCHPWSKIGKQNISFEKGSQSKGAAGGTQDLLRIFRRIAAALSSPVEGLPQVGCTLGEVAAPSAGLLSICRRQVTKNNFGTGLTISEY